MESIESLRQSLEKDADGEIFFKLSLKLIESTEGRAELRERCLKWITHQPSDLRARLVFAKALYLDGYLEFSIRELIELRRRKHSPSLDALINSFGPLAADFERPGHKEAQTATEFLQPEAIDETLGEIDFDLGMLDDE